MDYEPGEGRKHSTKTKWKSKEELNCAAQCKRVTELDRMGGWRNKRDAPGWKTIEHNKG